MATKSGAERAVESCRDKIRDVWVTGNSGLIVISLEYGWKAPDGTHVLVAHELDDQKEVEAKIAELAECQCIECMVGSRR